MPSPASWVEIYGLQGEEAGFIGKPEHVRVCADLWFQDSTLLPAKFCVMLQVTTGEMRARMGEVAHQRSDFVILTDSDPGLEDPREIIQASA